MKNKDEISKMKNALQSELDRLPDYDYFGDSNDESKENLRLMIVSLESLENGGTAENEEVALWFDGEDSELSVYEEED